MYKGTLYIDTNGGTLYALNAVTGAKRCSIALNGGVTETPPAAVAAPDGSGALVLLGGLGKKQWAVYGAGNTHGQTSSRFRSPPGPSCGPRRERRPVTTPRRPYPGGACSTST